MLSIKDPKELTNFKNFDLGYGDWVLIDQKLINDFAEVSGDNQWIHVDVKRASTDMPEGQTIAHGLLTLCLSTKMGQEQLKIENTKLIINYGIDNLRFTSPVKVNSRIRMHPRLFCHHAIPGIDIPPTAGPGPQTDDRELARCPWL